MSHPEFESALDRSKPLHRPRLCLGQRAGNRSRDALCCFRAVERKIVRGAARAFEEAELPALRGFKLLRGKPIKAW